MNPENVKQSVDSVKSGRENLLIFAFQGSKIIKKTIMITGGADAQFYIDAKFQNSDPDFIQRMREYFIS